MRDATTVNPIAIVGAGPAGFFAAEALLKRPSVRVDLFERLAAPFGLVRYGVAPDHQKIKQVEAGFTRTASDPRLRYFGNVSLGQDLSVSDLLEAYDQVVFAMGCQAARPLGVSGESTVGVYSALDFVSWYNAHPEYVSLPVRLDVENVVVVGAGDVSLDLSRLLTATDAELATTDMPPYALAEFKKRRVKRVHVLIRRGPENANFALKELHGVLDREYIRTECDTRLLSTTLADASLPKEQRAKLEFILACCERSRSQASSAADPRIHFHFLRSPHAFVEQAGRLARVRVELNRLEPTSLGEPRAVGSGEFEDFDAELAIFAVGYRGVKVSGIELDSRSGLIPNDEGRVTSADGKIDQRQYVVGWLKRGPQGVIGTNKGDARATVEHMLQNLPEPSRILPPTPELLRQRGVRFVDFKDWQELDRLERERGALVNKPREKWLSTKEAIEALSTAKV